MSECILKVNNLTKFYNNVKVLDGVSLTIKQKNIWVYRKKTIKGGYKLCQQYQESL